MLGLVRLLDQWYLVLYILIHTQLSELTQLNEFFNEIPPLTDEELRKRCAAAVINELKLISEQLKAEEDSKLPKFQINFKKEQEKTPDDRSVEYNQFIESHAKVNEKAASCTRILHKLDQANLTREELKQFISQESVIRQKIPQNVKQHIAHTEQQYRPLSKKRQDTQQEL